MKKHEELTLLRGAEVSIKFEGFFSDAFSLLFGGWPSSGTDFVLNVIGKVGYGYSAVVWHPVEEREIIVANHLFTVVSVSKEQLVLRYIGKR